MGTAAIYARISDDREGRELGVTDQVKHCRELVAQSGLTVVGEPYIDNDISASTRSRKVRPEYQRLLADARAGRFAVIVALSTSRLTRRPIEHEDLIDLAVKVGVRYQFVKSPSFDLNTADGRMVARTLAAADAAEAERTGERVKLAVTRRAERGEFHGGSRTFGFHAPVRGQREQIGLVIHEDEAAMIRQWAERVLAGGSVRGIAVDLNRRGVPSALGSRWRPTPIRRILCNPRMAGLRVLDGVEYPAPHPAILPVDTWRAVVRQLEPSVRRESKARKHLLVGLARCERCDVTVASSYDRHHVLIYKCMTCWRGWRAERLNAFIVDMVVTRLAQPNTAELLVRSDNTNTIGDLRTELTAARMRLNQIAEDFADGALTAGQLRTITARLRVKVDEIEAALADAGRTNPLAPLVLAADPVKAWAAIEDLERRRVVVAALMTVVLGAPARGPAPWRKSPLLDASRWVGDELTWGQRWKQAAPPLQPGA